MIEQLTEIMVKSGATWVLWLLIGLSITAVAVGLERLWAFKKVEADVASLVAALRGRLSERDYAGAEKLLTDHASVPADAVRAGLAEHAQGAEAAEEAMAASMGLSRARLSRGLLILGTIGNNAHFIGLLGTVIGVVGAFDALGATDTAGPAAAAASLAPERVMATIAEALVATAVGLLVAIPAVAVFNYFQGRLNAAIQDAETLGHVLLSHLRGARMAQPAETHAVAGHTGAALEAAE